MSPSPLVSVLIFAYNHEDYIKETINSVLCQKCSFNFEILVSDDHSTDKTLDIIKNLQIKHSDLIKVLSNEHNLGLNLTFINAVKSAKGEYIAILGGDDYWILDNKLELQVNIFLSNKEITYVHTDFKSFNETNNIITNHCNKNWRSVLTKKTGEKALVEMLRHNWTGYPLSSSSCFRKNPLLKGLNKHPEILNYNLAGEGTIIHASMIYYGGLYAFIPIQTTVYRIRKKSLSHYESKADQFEYTKKYFLLRLFVADSFGLTKDGIKKIQKRNLFELFQTALKLDTIDEFKVFIKTDNSQNKTGYIYDLLIYLSKNNLIKLVIRLTLRIIKSLQYRLNKFPKV